MPEHTCRVPQCTRARKEWALTCLPCWRRVPQELKDKLHDAGQDRIPRGLAAYAIISWSAGTQEEVKL